MNEACPEQKDLAERCEGKDPRACNKLGEALLLRGMGDAQMSEARHFLELACRQGWETGDVEATHACTLLGVAHLVGLNGFPENPKLGTDLLGERCAMKDDLACAYIAYARERGLGGVAPDLPRAVDEYEELCSVLHDGFEDAVPPLADTDVRGRRQPFACLRLAELADSHVVDVTPEFVAQLFASVCFNAESFPSDLTTAQPDHAAIGRIACTSAAERFLEAGYEFRGFRGGWHSFRAAAPEDRDIEDLMLLGCYDGSAKACTMLRTHFEEAEGRGEIFDLR